MQQNTVVFGKAMKVEYVRAQIFRKLLETATVIYFDLSLDLPELNIKLKNFKQNKYIWKKISAEDNKNEKLIHKFEEKF